MPRDGALTLSDYPSSTLRLTCAKCGRAGRLSRARLILEHRADVKLPDLRHRLARCQRTLPNHRPRSESDPCGVEYAGL